MTDAPTDKRKPAGKSRVIRFACAPDLLTEYSVPNETLKVAGIMDHLTL